MEIGPLNWWRNLSPSWENPHRRSWRNAFKKHKQKHNSDKKEKVDKSVQRVNFEEEKALDLSKPRQCSPGLTDGRDVGPPDPPNRNEDRSNTEVAERNLVDKHNH